MAKTQKTLGPRVDEKTADWLNRCFGSTNAGAEYLLAAFPALYARTIINTKEIFTASELSLFIDIHNSAMLTPAMAGQHIMVSCEDSMDLDNTDEKWDIDPDIIRQKLDDLTIFERACLEIWACAFWEQQDQPDALSLETYIA